MRQQGRIDGAGGNGTVYGGCDDDVNVFNNGSGTVDGGEDAENGSGDVFVNVS